MTLITNQAPTVRRSVAGLIRDLIEEIGARRSRMYRTRPAGPSRERVERYLAAARVRQD